jgi:hypothetical protein
MRLAPPVTGKAFCSPEFALQPLAPAFNQRACSMLPGRNFVAYQRHCQSKIGKKIKITPVQAAHRSMKTELNSAS